MEFVIEKVNPFVFGTGKRDESSVTVGDLSGHYLSKVYVSDLRGKLNFRIALCNSSDIEANIEISASFIDSSGDLLWSTNNSKFDIAGKSCPKIIGFNVYEPEDYMGGIKVSDLKYPIRLAIQFSEMP